VLTALVLVADLAVVAGAVLAFRLALRSGATVTAATVAGAAMSLVSPIAWTHHLVFLCFPLLLLVGRPGWRPKALLAGAVVVLVDPVGFGASAATSVVRTLILVGVLAFADRLVRAEIAWRRADGLAVPFKTGPAPGQILDP
jgi:hypothetical protein